MTEQVCCTKKHETNCMEWRSTNSGERDVRYLARCEEKRREWAKHWQCNTEVQGQKEQPWRSEELRSLEEGMPRFKESDSEKAARSYKATTGVGCDGFHPQSSVRFVERTRGRVVELCEKVKQRGRPQQGCTTMFFLIQKNVTSERPRCTFAYHDSLVRRVAGATERTHWCWTWLKPSCEPGGWAWAHVKCHADKSCGCAGRVSETQFEGCVAEPL